jgi:hypothetical protein
MNDCEIIYDRSGKHVESGAGTENSLGREKSTPLFLIHAVLAIEVRYLDEAASDVSEGESDLDQSRYFAHIRPPGKPGLEQRHYPPHILLSPGADSGNRFSDSTFHLVIAQCLRHVGLQHFHFILLYIREILPVSCFILDNGVSALLEHFFDNGNDDCIVQLSALIHLTLLYRSLQQSDGITPPRITRSHRGFHIFGYLLFQTHGGRTEIYRDLRITAYFSTDLN